MPRVAPPRIQRLDQTRDALVDDISPLSTDGDGFSTDGGVNAFGGKPAIGLAVVTEVY